MSVNNSTHHTIKFDHILFGSGKQLPVLPEYAFNQIPLGDNEQMYVLPHHKLIIYNSTTRVLRVKENGIYQYGINEYGCRIPETFSLDEVLEKCAHSEKFFSFQGCWDKFLNIDSHHPTLVFKYIVSKELLRNEFKEINTLSNTYHNDLDVISNIFKGIFACIELGNSDFIQEIHNILAEFSKDNIQDLFNKLSRHNGYDPESFKKFVQILKPFLDLSKEENAVKLMEIGSRFGADDLIRDAFKLHPHLLHNEITYWKDDENPLFVALANQQFNAARCLIEQGWNCNQKSLRTQDFDKPLTEFPLTKTLQHIFRKEKDEIQDYGQFFVFLLEHGADPNLQIISPQTGIPQSIAEYCLFYRGKNQTEVHSLVTFLIFHGANVTHAMGQRMKQMLKEPCGSYYANLLKETSLTTEDELHALIQDDSPKGTLADYQHKITLAKTKLQQMLAQNRGNWELVDLSLIEEFKQLKKEIKIKSEIRLQLDSLYTQFVALYDDLVNRHPLLKELREASKELRERMNRQDTPPSGRLSKICSLWAQNVDIYTREKAQKELNSIAYEERSRFWYALRKPILATASRIFTDPFWRRGYVSLIHGTKMSPTILRTKALLPKGMLDQEGIVPFSGEILGNDRGTDINAENISCSSLSWDWEERIQGYFMASTRLLISLIYSMQSFGYGENEKFFERAASLQRTEWEEIRPHLEQRDSQDLAVRSIDILRLRSTEPQESKERFQKLLDEVEKLVKKEKPTKDSPLDRLHQALIIPIKYPITQDDLALIRKRIPVLFASMNRIGKSCPGEFLFKGPMEFGKDIQAAFVPAEHVEEMGKLLHEAGIETYDFDTAKFLETQSMVRGSQDAAFEASIESLQEVEKEQRRIAYYLEMDILPKYSIPFPRKPTFLSEDQRLEVPNPYFGHYESHEDYLNAVRDGLVVPRTTHGRMHASRVTILSQFFRKKVIQSGTKEQLDPVITAITAAAHDAQREDEGVDRWDEESAIYLHSYLLKQGYSEKDARYYARAIREKDPKNHLFESNIQKIVHDADCLEILRCLKPPNEFRKEELQIKVDDNTIQGWSDFIKLTDQDQLHLALEQNTENYYADVMRILKLVGPAQVCTELSKELACYNPEDLPQKVKEVLETLLKTQS